MKGIAFKYRRFLSDTIPVLLALVVAVAYFLTVVPNSRPHWGEYILAIGVLFVIDRVFVTWFYKTRLLPPIVAYKRGKREGKAFSKGELTRFYLEFAAHVPKSQVMSLWGWVAAIVMLSLTSYFLIQHSVAAVVGVIFTGLIAGTISISASYFFVKWLMGPLQEEVIASLDQLPDVGKSRVSFRTKMAVSVMAIAVIAFTAFGALVYSRLFIALDSFAIDSGRAQGKSIADWLNKSPADEWEGVLREQASPLWSLVVLDATGAPMKGLASGPFDPRVFSYLAQQGKTFVTGRQVLTGQGRAYLYPVNGGHYLALVANPESAKGLMEDMSLYGGGFLIITILTFGIYILWLSRDMSGILRRIEEANDRLAAGDLTRVPSIWADDEMGHVADNLRTTFHSLSRMTREVAVASSAVDEEVSKTVSVTESLHQQVASQTYFADKTTQSVKLMEEGIQRVSKAMEQVANATQEVSSTILEMQASVEEIARNSDVLIQSVEKTVSSSNQISASATEIQSSTDRLHHSGQEAVSFLAELDASLEETRRNARALSDAASKVTQDAEAGFSAVAAVEEEILRTSTATDLSRGTLRELVGSIEKIGRIVDVIQDVTEQTNLLSLNASIIAAGAGEYGKSFAVVATQIRELSARTAGNAKEIRALIRSLTTSGAEMAGSMEKTYSVVSNSAALSRTAGETLRTILESASSQEEMNKRIAAATEELAHGGQSANRAMHQIFEMIEGIVRATRDQVASTRYLNEEAERVRDVAIQLKNATEEQAKGTRVISDAVTHIMEDSRQTNLAVQSQAQESRAIYEAMRQVTATAQAIEAAFTQLTDASSHLQRSASVLRQEIRSFKTA